MIAIVRAAAFAVATTIAAGAAAAECPAGNVLTTANTPEMKEPAGVEAVVLETVALKDWRGVGDLMLRTRRLEIAPGGVVPTHSHADRPAIITIVSGEIVEHSSLCSSPIVHKAGDSTAEFGGALSHWWENVSGAPVTVLSSDVVPAEEPDGSMM